ncbi:MAG TPA: hypothetical protein VGQ76_01995 [Thermoanaerobaculia bacterium]|jgi:hypothetical protein|nr:hypothetical protein [Thermoanaerobaculia bacterium]
MTARRLVEIVLRLWVLSLVLPIVTSAVSLGVTFQEMQSEAVFRSVQIGSIAGLALIVIAAVLAFVYAPAIASRLVPESDVVTTSIDAHDLAGIALSIIAIFLLIYGARDLISGVYSIAARPRWEDARFADLLPQQKEAVLRAVVLIIGGTVLIWRRNELREWMSR